MLMADQDSASVTMFRLIDKGELEPVGTPTPVRANPSIRRRGNASGDLPWLAIASSCMSSCFVSSCFVSSWLASSWFLEGLTCA